MGPLIQEGFYGWRNEDNKLVTNIAIPTYLKCERDGRLSGCLFRFDNPDEQCTDMRKGERKEGGGGWVGWRESKVEGE